MNKTNLNILFEDSHIIVCVKPHGIATQSKQIGSPDMVNLIKKHIFMNNPDKGEPYLAVIHRLDQPVKGILVFAKTPFAAKELNKQLGILETTTEYNEVRAKMIDIHHYNSILYKMVEWKEFNEIQEELDEIRIQARETQK